LTVVPGLPVVSCLITVYNHERWIVDAIDSALAQADDYPADKLDIVLVDDGSTDATPELVARYRGRIRAVRKPNGGVLSTVNRALELARGELFCFLSGDDVWHSGKIRRQVHALLERPEVGLLYGDAEIIDASGVVVYPSYYKVHRMPHPEGDIRGALLEKNVVCAPTAMMRMSLRERFHPIGPPAVWEDWWMFVHAAQAGPVAYLDGAYVGYRVHGDNMHAGLSGDELLRFLGRELPFRRWLLTETDFHGIAVHDVLAAWCAFESHVGDVARAGLAALDELVPVGPGERERAQAAQRAAAAARDAGAPEAAAKSLIRALAWDPGAPVRPQLADAMQQTEATAALPPASVRGVVVLAHAEELMRQPHLLSIYAETFGEEDDVTLVVNAYGWSDERVALELVPLAARYGLGDGGPDALVLTDGRRWPRERLAAILSARTGAPGEVARRVATAQALSACVETCARPESRSPLA
jgi:glycosyltransferase involved in cell wall biosynthesis